MLTQPPTHAHLETLVRESRWQEIVEATENLPEPQSLQPGFSFFRGMGLTKSGRATEGLASIRRGLELNPQSKWGNKLLFDALRTNGELREAFEGFEKFIDSSSDSESEKAWYVQWAAELGLLDLAAEMNEKRDVIRNVPRAPKLAIGIQCFCKDDTLEDVFRSLISANSSKGFSLVILQDSVILSSNPGRYSEGYSRVQNLIAKWLPELAKKFFSVQFIENDRNLGTAPSCRRLLDYISDNFDGFLFLEDDCVLAPSALDWTRYHLSNSISMKGPWFATCESSYFDKEGRELAETTKAKLEKLASTKALKNAFVLNDYVNSTCFATTADIWRVCASYRSFTRGPESLSRFVQTKGIMTLAPIVPRCSDIGMLHQLGYSVANAGVENVRERKEVFLTSPGIFDEDGIELYSGDRNLLFQATSKLDENAIALLESSLNQH